MFSGCDCISVRVTLFFTHVTHAHTERERGGDVFPVRLFNSLCETEDRRGEEDEVKNREEETTEEVN